MPEQEYFEYTGGEPFSINMRAPRNTATRYASGPTPPKLPARRRMLFCDLDGVLADFDAGVLRVTGKLPRAMSLPEMWRELGNDKTDGGFFASLPWMEQGPALWREVEQYDPVILTGKPRGSWAKQQKLQWCEAKLGVPPSRVIVCEPHEKARFAHSGDVLIDDSAEKYQKAWEARGGVFIHHTGETDVRKTIALLRSTLEP